jgi:hypothetical protein
MNTVMDVVAIILQVLVVSSTVVGGGIKNFHYSRMLAMS